MTHDRLRTAIVGGGYVGTATAVGLAEQGHDVILVEEDPERLAALADDRIPQAFVVRRSASSRTSRLAVRMLMPCATWTSAMGCLADGERLAARGSAGPRAVR